jgi:hypothetical protein
MSDNTIEIAAYDMGHFPETQDESTDLGKAIVAKQFVAVKKLIAGAFQDVFHKNWEESFMKDCKRLPAGEKMIVLYKNRPFLELGEIEEDFVMKNGTQHLVFNQSYRVM